MKRIKSELDTSDKFKKRRDEGGGRVAVMLVTIASLDEAARASEESRASSPFS